MSLYDIPNMTNGIDSTLVDIATTVPSLIPGLLLFVWGLVFMSGNASQRVRSGYSDAPLWATLASLSTLLVTLMLTVTAGLVSIEILGIVLAVTLFSALWLFLSKGKGEV